MCGGGFRRSADVHLRASFFRFAGVVHRECTVAANLVLLDEVVTDRAVTRYPFRRLAHAMLLIWLTFGLVLGGLMLASGARIELGPVLFAVATWTLVGGMVGGALFHRYRWFQHLYDILDGHVPDAFVGGDPEPR